MGIKEDLERTGAARELGEEGTGAERLAEPGVRTAGVLDGAALVAPTIELIQAHGPALAAAMRGAQVPALSSSDEKLREFALSQGLEFVMLEDVGEGLADFMHWEWTPERKQRILEARTELEKNSKVVEEFLKRMAVAGGLARRDPAAMFGTIQGAKALLAGLSYGHLVEEELGAVVALVDHSLTAGLSPELYGQISAACQRLRAVFRYRLERYKETYCGGRIGADNGGRMLGYNDCLPLLFDENGNELTFVDYGCGDGDFLIGIRREKDSVRIENEVVDEVLADFCRNDLGKDLSSGELEGLGVGIRHRLHKTLKAQRAGAKYRRPPSTDPYLIGIDQIDVKNWLRRHGVTGRQADLCLPFDELCRRTKLGRNKVHNGATILTADRVPDPGVFLNNVVETIVPGGRVLVGTKGIIQGTGDGKGKGAAYSEASYGNDRFSSLTNFLQVLRRHGLNPKRMSQQNYLVISTDCPAVGRGAQPQRYRLVLIGCEVEKSA